MVQAINLSDNEKIIEKARISWLSLIGPAFAACCIVGIPWFCRRVINLLTTQLYLTNERVYGRIGLFNTVTIDTPLKEINTTMVEHTLLSQILNYGTFHLRCASGVFLFIGVKNPDAFKTLIMKEIGENQKQIHGTNVVINNNINNN